MKKIFFAMALFAFTFSYANTTVDTNNKPVKVQVQPDTYKVKVCMIKNQGRMVVANNSKSGIYDSETNKITIDGNTYSVKVNPEYGENTKRGPYEYVAGGCYYFNL